MDKGFYNCFDRELFLYFTFYLLMATVTIFATDRFHASPSAAGLASGIFVVRPWLRGSLPANRLTASAGKRCFMLVLLRLSSFHYFIL